MSQQVRLGDRVKHKVNGSTGVTTGRAEYLNGCRQFLVGREELDDKGRVIEGLWFDEQYLEVLDPQVMTDPFANSGQPALAGGPDRKSLPTY